MSEHPYVAELRDAVLAYNAANEALAALVPTDTVETAERLAREYVETSAHFNDCVGRTVAAQLRGEL